MAGRLYLAMLLFALMALRACAGQAQTALFGNPERVTIAGYTGDAMEPFLSRDGRYLFFNNRNEPSVNTNLFWAERVDDLHFRFRGEVQNVNTSALEGVASLDREGNFYFVSNRSYDRTASTLYRGHFENGSLSGIELVPGVSLAKPGIVNFDAEISADGNTLYFVESQFTWLGKPRSARIVLARRNGGSFVRDAGSDALMKEVNGVGLNYAPALTASELEIFFTRADAHGPVVYEASRQSKEQAFDRPVRLTAITGFAEAPTVSPDGNTLYFHKKEGDRFVLYRVARNAK